MTEEVPIESRDYWFKIVEFPQQNWALVDTHERGAIAWFIGDTSGVFDQIVFSSAEGGPGSNPQWLSSGRRRPEGANLIATTRTHVYALGAS
jgi:hypothetical protein